MGQREMRRCVHGGMLARTFVAIKGGLSESGLSEVKVHGYRFVAPFPCRLRSARLLGRSGGVSVGDAGI